MANQNQSTTPAQIEKNICDNVLARINQFKASGALKLPSDYSAENALKVAFLQLTDQTVKVDNSDKPVLDHCTQPSIANALLKMVTQGLNPMKRQCSFITYGNKLTMQREYQGSIALAKRYGLEDINGNVIYKGDEFVYTVDPETGCKKLVKHEQDFENIDLSNIRGAYVITKMGNGKTQLTVMNINQIKKAWQQGFGGGNTKAHQNFTDEMCLKTVYNRACKPIINQSDDSNLVGGNEEEEEGESTIDIAAEVVKNEISDKANKGEVISFEEDKPPVKEEKLKEADPAIKDKAKLKELGYSDEDIAKMSPADIMSVIMGNTKKVSKPGF